LRELQRETLKDIMAALPDEARNTIETAMGVQNLKKPSN
jgi:hypothetical protein